MRLAYNFIGNINDNSIGNLIGYLHSKKEPIEYLQLNICSTGGSVSSAITIYNFLKNAPFTVTTHNLGEVTSAAIILYLAGNKRTSEKISKFLMHPVRVHSNDDLSYFQLLELTQLLDMDIENYAKIVNLETNSLNGLYNVKEILKSKSLSLDYDSAIQCGIITQ